MSAAILYLIEFMTGEEVRSSKTTEASTPFIAASKAARGCVVHFAIDRSDWIRVTPPGKPPVEYGYTRMTDTAVVRKPLRKLRPRKA